MAQGYSHLYGINKGAAQVWQGNAGLDYLQQSFEQDRKRREKENAELDAQVAKIDTSKVREADRDDVYKMYDEVKNLRRQYDATNNREERRRILAEFEDAKKKTVDFSVLSQQAGVGELEMGKARYKPNVKLHRNFAKNFSGLTSTRLLDTNYKSLAEKATGELFAPDFDEDKYFKGIEARAVEQINDPKVYSERVAGGTRSYELKGAKVNPEKLATQIIKDAQTDEGLRDRITDSFPELPFKDATQAYIKYTQELLESKNKVEKRNVTIDKDDNTLANHIAKRNWDRAHGFGDDADSPSSTSTPIDIPFSDGKGAVHVKDYRAITTSKKNFAGSDYYDMNTGKLAGKLQSSGDYEIVGVGNFPFLNDDKSKHHNAIVTKDWEEKHPEQVNYKKMVHVQFTVKQKGGLEIKKNALVPFDRLPRNVESSKPVKQALNGLSDPKNNLDKSTTSKTNSVSSGKKTIKGF